MKSILKKSAVLSILSVLLITLIIPVFAHPGSLDENGGHYNRSTGEYHYHHGYPAHQHENGECPYDFKDNVDDDYTPSKKPSPDDSNISNETTKEPNTEAQTTKQKSKKNRNKDSEKSSFFTIVKEWFSDNRDNIICIWVYCIFIPLCAVYLFYTVIKKEHPLWLNISFGISAAISIIVYFLSL